MKKCKYKVLVSWLCFTEGGSHTNFGAGLSHQRGLDQVTATSLITKFLYDNEVS